MKYPGSTTGNITYSCTGDGTISVTSSDTTVITVGTVGATSTPLTANKIGSSTISVSRAAGTNYNAATAVTQVISVTGSTYTVTLDNQSATSAGSTSVTATYGSAVPTITPPTKTGYDFGGYSTNGGGTQYINSSGTSARNWDSSTITTLYAKWTIISKTCSAGQYLAKSSTSCSGCPAGSYCPGGTYTYNTSSDQGKTACATGSYSAANSSVCTACTGKTTSGTGQTSCNANCSNTSNVSTWNTASWSANSVSNLCSINSCASGYGLSSNACYKKLVVGDYISLTPDKTSYSIPTSITGYDSAQTINPSELKLWRVISENDDGSVDAVSEYVSSTEVYFQGTRGYANFVGGLQTIAAQYAKSNYTTKVRMMGYDGQTLTISNTSAFDGSTNTAPSTTSTPSPTTGTGQEYSGGVLGDTLYLKDYLLVKNVYGNVIANKVGTTTATPYWLASRGFGYYGATYFFFHGRFVHIFGDLQYYDLRVFESSWFGDSVSLSVRPIITLKSGVGAASGSGTIASPYVLN